MKKVSVTIIIILVTHFCWAQYNPKALTILDAMSKKYKKKIEKSTKKIKEAKKTLKKCTKKISKCKKSLSKTKITSSNKKVTKKITTS